MAESELLYIAEAISIALTVAYVFSVVGLLSWLARRDWPLAQAKQIVIVGIALAAVSCIYAAWGGPDRPWLFYDQLRSVAEGWTTTRLVDVEHAATQTQYIFISVVVAVSSAALAWLARRDRPASFKLAAAALLLLMLMPCGMIGLLAILVSPHHQVLHNLNQKAAACHARLVSVDVGWSADELAGVLREPMLLNDADRNLAHPYNLHHPSITRLSWPSSGQLPARRLRGHRVIQACETYTSSGSHRTWYEFHVSGYGTVVQVEPFDHYLIH